MRDIINKEDIEKFRDEVTLFNSLKNNHPTIPSGLTNIELSDYLKWVEVKRINNLLEVLKSKD